MWVALIETGVDVRPLNAQQVALTVTATGSPTGGEPWTVEVKTWDRPLTPSIIRSAAAQRAATGDAASVLAIAPSISSQARKVAGEAGWSVVATNPGRSSGPDGVLVRPDGRNVPIGASVKNATTGHVDRIPHRGNDAEGREPDRRGRRGYGASWVSRLLLSGRSFTQRELSAATGLTQPRVSQTLRQLQHLDLARGDRESAGAARWHAADWSTLLDHWLTTYPGPAGIRTHWYGLGAPGDVADQVLDVLRREPDSVRQPQISGAVAADRIAPWSRPASVIVFADHGVDLTSIGLTPARPSDATVELVVPADPGVWLSADRWPTLADRHVADPIQILWDLRHHSTGDADQAFDHLRQHLGALAAHPNDRDQ